MRFGKCLGEQHGISHWLMLWWGAYTLAFSLALYLLMAQDAALRKAAMYASEAILWDISQCQRELLLLTILLERMQGAENRPPAATAIAQQLDLAWSNLDRLEQGVSHQWHAMVPDMAQAVRKLRRLFEQFDTLRHQFGSTPREFAQHALPVAVEAHGLTNRIMGGVHQAQDRHTTLLQQAFRNFHRYLIGSAIGLIGFMLLLAYLTWSQYRAKVALQKAHDILDVRVQERTADLQASNDSLRHAMAERERLEAELLRTQKLESLGVLAGGIAHDFNNILAVIMGNVSLARLGVEPQTQLARDLTAAEGATQRAAELTRQLLTFSKGDAPVRQTASMTALVRESAGFVLRGSSAHCELALPDTLWPVYVDAGQMNQVLNNILINAVQAMPHGGSISVSAENCVLAREGEVPLRPGRYVKVSITDEGVGIPVAHLANIFDPYYTTKQQGNGLGLATAYAIMHKHHGAITVTSTVGVGTTFHLYLPVSTDTVPVAEAREEGLAHGHGKILIMDDEPAIRALAQGTLVRLGYEVAVACDGAEAIALYRQAQQAGHPFAAVIMDLTIPGGMGGKEALQKIQEIDPHVTAIVSSGYSTDPVMAHYQHYGFKGVVAKPYRISDLSTTVRRVLAET